MSEIINKADKGSETVRQKVRKHLVELVDEHLNDLTVPPPSAFITLMEEILPQSPLLQKLLAEAVVTSSSQQSVGKDDEDDA